MDDRGHTKKLKEYFINEKVPKEMRDTMLLLTEDSHVIWRSDSGSVQIIKSMKIQKRY